MELSDLSKLYSKFDNNLITIDSHTAGEMTRLIIGGVDDITGDTMLEKLNFFKENCDFIRKRLTQEPRGHSGVLAAMVTPPVTKDAEFGLIYMDAKRYPFLCGHATIGSVATLFRTGLLHLEQGINRVKIDTVSGVMEAETIVSGNEIESISIQMVPSFVLDTGLKIDVDGFGPFVIDLVCVGGFFAMVTSEQTGKALSLEHKSFFKELGMQIIESANDQLDVYHPERPEVKTIDVVEFYDPEKDKNFSGTNLVVYGEANIDRSPCGTGTSAKLTLMHHNGLIKVGQNFKNSGPLGTSFNAKILQRTKIKEIDGVIVEITGMAQVTGIHNFVLEESDAFPEGFLI